MTRSQQGAAFAVTAYSVWGVVPVYFKALGSVDALDVLCHRIVWSFVLLAGFVTLTRRGAALRALVAQPRKVLALFASSLLVSSNWLIYIWAVQHDRIVETTLGYFINPLLSVLLGVVFLGERIGRLQTLAIAIAALGVLNEVMQAGRFPWVGVSLAVTFGLYGLVRKRAAIDAMAGLALETGLLAPLALAGLALTATDGREAFVHQGALVSALLVGTGLVTSVPLVCFAAAALRLPLSILGIFQYLAPSIALVIAVVVYGEPFTARSVVTFACIWSGLALFAGSALYAERRRRTELSAALR